MVVCGPQALLYLINVKVTKLIREESVGQRDLPELMERQ
ncbi:hypothetical protein SBA3_2170022 [Candidatus Sulfopaludibacter sp. SbA3]|nr:hypothetical protein SBA3_2170022 [Candidatus Sulfopaludibacter sp. SbA3]